MDIAPNTVPTSPVTVELILAETAPLEVNIANEERLLKSMGVIPVGVIRMQCAPALSYPAFLNTLPSMLILTPNETGPVREIKVPLNIELAPVDMGSSDTQNILFELAPLIKVTVVPTPVVNGPVLLMINSEFGSPPPSNISVPAIDVVPTRSYTPGGKFSPLQKTRE
jgi:hypothetical protein